MAKLGLFLFEQEQQEEIPLYHVTFYRNLSSISQNGLQHGMSKGIGSSAYNKHRMKGLFLTEFEGVRYWFNKAVEQVEQETSNPLEDGLVPVVLRINPNAFTEELGVDQLGTSDAKIDAWISPQDVSPEFIEVWNGSDWLPVDEWEMMDQLIAIDQSTELLLPSYNNPLLPKSY